MPISRDPGQFEPQDLTDNLLAIRHFTNREAAIAAFRRHVDAPEGHTLPVLHFYGVGGVGKTLLLHKLAAELRDEQPPVPWARLDFEDTRSRDPVRALTWLRVHFEQQHRLSFPEFDLLRAVLAAKEGGPEEELAPLSGPLKGLWEGVQQLVSPLGAGLKAAEGLLAPLGKQYPWLEDTIRRLGGTQGVLSLRALEPQQLLDRMLRAFARELSEGLPARPARQCRGVLFLDTYERLWTGTAGPTGPQAGDADGWIRELYAYLAHLDSVLVVIAGRDRLCWPESDPDWAKLTQDEMCRHLDAHLIGGLSPEDAQRYLARCGVGPPPEAQAPSPLQAAIIECSLRRSWGGSSEPRPPAESGVPATKGCHPLFVGLCANIVLNERRNAGHDPDPSVFCDMPGAEVARRLAARFLRSLHDPVQAELVRDLSVARWFDLELVAARLDQGLPAARAAHNTLAHFSFVEPSPDGRLRMHSTMREALEYLLEQDDPARWRETHAWCRAHWEARHAAGQPAAEPEAFYHRLHLDPSGAIDCWLRHSEEARVARNGDRCRGLLALWEGLDLAEDAWREQVGDQAWASWLVQLGDRMEELRSAAWQHAPVLRRAIQCYQAALTVWTEADFPVDWATTQHSLGRAHIDFPTGDRAANLQQAVRCCEAALRVRTESEFPADWARTQHNLGVAHWSLPTGDRAANLQQAIRCFEAALRVRREADFPTDWAMTQNNLGVAYWALRAGDRAANLQQAIRCHEATLRVLTETEAPVGWGMTQDNLGNAYQALPIGDPAANLQQAIRCYEAALRVRTEADLPVQWAATQNNLGIAYGKVPTGDRAANLRTAISCYEAALRVRTKADFPEKWAMTQKNLGNAYAELPAGNQAANLREAIRCYEAALTVWTEDAFPRDHEGAVASLAETREELARLSAGAVD